MTTDTVDRFPRCATTAAATPHRERPGERHQPDLPVDSEEYQGLVEEITDKQGWYITLGGTGEKMLAAPSVYFNVIFTTFTPEHGEVRSRRRCRRST